MKEVLAVLFAALSTFAEMPILQAQENAIQTKLDRAKSEYDSEYANFTLTVVKYFEDQEKALRRKGDKEGLDSLQIQKELFTSYGVLSQSVSQSLRQKRLRLRERLLKEYEVCIREFIKHGMDSSAKHVEEERTKFVNAERAIPIGTWNVAYHGNRVKAVTTIASDLKAKHIDNVGRNLVGKVELHDGYAVVKYDAFVEEWRFSEDMIGFEIKHFYPAASYPNGTPTHQASAKPR